MSIYISKEYGCMFWLDDNVLMGCPMSSKSDIYNTSNQATKFEVDFENISKSEVKNLNNVKQKLLVKNLK